MASRREVTMFDPPFDPSARPADEHVRKMALGVSTAFALLTDDDDAGRWGRCRTEVLGYLHASRLSAAGDTPVRARARLRQLARTWTAPELPPTVRARLDQRCGFWVGTVFGLRWRESEAAPRTPVAASARVEAIAASPVLVGPGVGAGADGATASLWKSPPLPGEWEAMRAWRLQLAAERAQLRARRARQSELRLAARVLREARSTMSDPTAPIPAPTGSVGRPSDAEIRELALRIRAAVRRTPGEDEDDILLPSHELGAEDEARIEAALLALDDREDADRMEGTRPTEHAPHAPHARPVPRRATPESEP